MPQTDSWSSLSPPHVGRLLPKQETSALVSYDIRWWTQGQPVPLWSSCPRIPSVTWMEQSTSLSATRRNIRACPLQLLRPTMNCQANIRWDQCLMIQGREWSSFDSIVFNRRPCTLWIRLLLWRTRRRPLWMAPCDTPMILDICLQKIPKPDNQKIFLIITSQILIGRFFVLVWGGKLHTTTAHSLMWSIQCATLPLGQLRKSALPRKEGGRDRTAVMIDHKCLSGGRKRSFEYCQGLYIIIDIDCHQLWGKTVWVRTVRRFHSIGG